MVKNIIYSAIPVLYNQKLEPKLYKKEKQGNDDQEIKTADYLGLE